MSDTERRLRQRNRAGLDAGAMAAAAGQLGVLKLLIRRYGLPIAQSALLCQTALRFVASACDGGVCVACGAGCDRREDVIGARGVQWPCTARAVSPNCPMQFLAITALRVSVLLPH